MQGLAKYLIPLLVVLGVAEADPGASDDSKKVVHVFVALCDNLNQGIVPVPPELGNGQSPRTNLYWGALYGVKTYFKSANGWNLVSAEQNPRDGVLERCIFLSRDSGVIVIADAYDGKEIRQTIEDFISSAAGLRNDSVVIDESTVACGGMAQLLAYVGHNGLMEFSVPSYTGVKDSISRETIILACASKPYFAKAIDSAGAHPLLWTTGLMAPEAYTLLAAIEAWAAGKPDDSVRVRAAEAYSRYQECSLRAAKSLLVTGW